MSDKKHTVVDIGSTEDIVFAPEKTADECKNFCQEHKANQNLFCEDCSQCICPMCCLNNHSSHKYLDHVSTKQEIESMNEKILSQLNDFSKASDSFKSKISELSENASSVLVQIDAHSLKICNTVKQSATEIKGKVNTWLQEEIKRLEHEKREIDIQKHIADVQSIKFNHTLRKQSFVDIWPNLVTLRQEFSELCAKPLVPLLPVVRKSKFVKGQIILPNLEEQVGSFDIEELPKRDNLFSLYKSQSHDFMTELYIKDIFKDGNGKYYKSDQVPWEICVVYRHGLDVKYAHCYIRLASRYHKDITQIDALVTFKLVNLLDKTKTIEKKLHHIPEDLVDQKNVELIDLKILEDETKGFLDSMYNFKIQTIVKIIKIVKK